MTASVSGNQLPKAKDLDEVFVLFKSAQKLTIHGQWIPWKSANSESPYNHTKDFLTDPIVITRKSDIDRIAALFMQAKFTYDPGLTKDFSAGVTVATLLRVSIDIDNSANVFVLGTDMLICKSHRTYVAKKYEHDEDTYFTEQLGWLLESIYKKK